MQKWEYLSKYIQADMQNKPLDTVYGELIDGDELPRYSPVTIMPELNRLGEKGWELVHIQPVAIGRNHDILVHEGGGARRWATNFFCVFKRPA